MAVALGGFAPSAFAYLDPSTGSMILSAIVGIIATVGLALKTYWYKLNPYSKGKRLPRLKQLLQMLLQIQILIKNSLILIAPGLRLSTQFCYR